MVTHFEFVMMKDGRAHYIDSISDLDDNVLIAKVKVITKNGKEVSRDQIIDKEKWMTVKEYYNKRQSN